jgi:hypothetical protein
MTNVTTPSSIAPVPRLEMAWQDVDRSFERFCLTAGHRSDRAIALRGRAAAHRRHSRGEGRLGPPLGQDQGERSASMAARLPCIAQRGYEGQEVQLPTWRAARGLAWPRASSGALYGFLRAIYRPSSAGR